MDPMEFLEQAKSEVILDVRSPAEYEKGHVVGATSFPIFSNDERAQVGITYKKQGRDAAVELGLTLVGPKLTEFVRSAKKLAAGKRIFMYCWRGGMRSSSMAWLLRTAGMEVNLLEGGYKNYRDYMYAFLEKPWKLFVVGGMTGSAKTEILLELREMGEQVLDLEGLAQHRGSAFGNLEGKTQPTVEHFQNLLFDQLHNMDRSRLIWVEDESQHIGSAWINEQFYNQMKWSPLVVIEKSLDDRVNHLCEIYGSAEVHQLKEVFSKIARRLGGQHVKSAHEFLDGGNIAGAVRIALAYYDKSYSFMLENKKHPKKIVVEAQGKSHRDCASLLCDLKKEYDQ